MQRFRFLAWTAPVIAVLVLFLAPPDRLAADILYAVDGAGGAGSTPSDLYTINPANGSVLSTIGQVMVNGTGVMVSGIAFDPINQQLYGAALVGGSRGNGELVTINLTSGVATPVGSFGLSPLNGGIHATSLAFASDGTLYAYVKQGSQPESLFTVNTTSGVATAVGSSGFPIPPGTSGDGLAMSASGTLYFAGKGDTGNLYTLSTTTGLATAGPTLSGAPFASVPGQIKGLAFNSSGMLYGIDIEQSSPFPANLVTINPTTGVITSVGGTQNGLVSFAFQPAAVPEPGSLSLMGLALALFIYSRARARNRPAPPGVFS